MREARRAGSQPASAPIVASRTIAATSVTGSRGGSPKSSGDTNRDAQRLTAAPATMPMADEDRRAPQDERDHAAGRGAERHADADLGSAPAHRIRRDAVEAEARQQQRERAEECGERRHDPLLRQRRIHLVGQRPERDPEVAVHLAERGRERLGQQRGRSAGRAHADRRGRAATASACPYGR